jgi:hypothetical protein
MANERGRKLIDDKLSFWEKTKVALTPGDAAEKSQRLEQMANDRVREEERAAALARARKPTS